MITYNTYPHAILKNGDEVIFRVRGVTYHGDVRHGGNGPYINISGSANSRLFKILKIDKIAFCEKAYGYPGQGGQWPEARTDDYAALTRCVRALFKKTKLSKKALARLSKQEKLLHAAEAAQVAALALKERKAAELRAAILRKLSKQARRAVAYLDRNPDAFGCQRDHVIALVGMLLNHDIAKVLKPCP
jgi:hypothetical protein